MPPCACGMVHFFISSAEQEYCKAFAMPPTKILSVYNVEVLNTQADASPDDDLRHRTKVARHHERSVRRRHAPQAAGGDVIKVRTEVGVDPAHRGPERLPLAGADPDEGEGLGEGTL
ncbi:hypothetical protein ON010_g7918 [Phytophthora cinnamomi]|nr:hypothetical protein ON010_g7918 [Phytophthora cinnamomi]